MLLDHLYQEVILDHGRYPRNFGPLHHANRSWVGHNPLCGDQLTIFAIETSDKIQAIKFVGQGCAICVASASLMIEAVQGKTRREMVLLFHEFQELVKTGQTSSLSMGKLLALGGVSAFPMRVKCATLAWHTLKAAMDGKHTYSVTTEYFIHDVMRSGHQDEP